MAKYANQKTLIINKKTYTKNFLQIGDSEWQEAFKKLKPTAFAIYLYLCDNSNGFRFDLSPQAIDNALGIKKTAYYSAIEQLTNEKYIVDGNFYTTPFENSANAEKEQIENSAFAEKSNIVKIENKPKEKEIRITPPKRKGNNYGWSDKKYREIVERWG